MKLNAALAVTGLVGLASAQKFVKLPFDKSVGSNYGQSSKNPLQKRDDVTGDGYTNIELGNQQTFYSVKLNIGTPTQEVTVLVDTGSSDLWIMGSDNSFCSANSGKNAAMLFRKGGQNKAIYQTIEVTLSPEDLNSGGSIDGDVDPFQWLSDIFPQVGGGGVATQTATIGGSGDGDGNGNGAIATQAAPAALATLDCSQYGTFDKEKSSSFKSNDTSFAISYGDNTYASGTWGTDTLHIGSVDVSDVSMAVANFTNSSIGVLGIGLPGLETTYSGGVTIHGAKSYQYSNFPMVLKDNGIIDSSAYSLYLDDPDASKGSVLFGAVDHSKYVNGLYTVPLINIYEEQNILKPVEFDVTLFGLGLIQKSKNITIAETSIPALLDSGTTISYFPPELLEIITSQLGATYSYSMGYYLMDCVSDDSTKLVFDFGGFHITAPLKSFQSQATRSQCMLMMSTQEDRIILGDVFLQNAYVVYDLENLEISMGQANFDSSSSDDDDDGNVELIKSNVPSAVQARLYSSTWSGSNMINTDGDIFTDVATAASNGNSSNPTVTGSASATATGKSTKITGSGTTSGHSTSTGSSVNKKQNAANISYSVHSIITYVMVLLATWFF